MGTVFVGIRNHGSSIPHHFQTLHSSEMRGVVRDDWHRMRECGGGDPNVVGADHLVRGSQVAGDYGVVVGGGFVHRQDVEFPEHLGAGWVVDVAKPFCKLPCDGPGEAGAGGGVFSEECVGFS